jgi:hypothetical protein
VSRNFIIYFGSYSRFFSIKIKFFSASELWIFTEKCPKFHINFVKCLILQKCI